MEANTTIRSKDANGLELYDQPAYYVGSDGKMVKGGFYKESDKYSVFTDTTGKLVTGFFMVDGTLYYVTNEYGKFSGITTTYRDETRTKFQCADGKERTLHHIYDGGKVLELDGNPIKSDDKFYQLIKYLPKYDSKGNFLGAIQN